MKKFRLKIEYSFYKLLSRKIELWDRKFRVQNEFMIRKFYLWILIWEENKFFQFPTKFMKNNLI